MDGLVKLVDGLNPVGDDWLAVRTHAFKILDFFQAVIGLGKELGVCTTSHIRARARASNGRFAAAAKLHPAPAARIDTSCLAGAGAGVPGVGGLMGWLVRVCLRVVHGPSTLV